ncbi:lytic polysaccharide monooxygenase [Umezawaea sp. Da 62-37]|uniref:lytic polysaccharide monooxygenase auxiliary activity family 9 protein n=1 Tax=Umezawaea sp. Da 62-37 TaxID=3075927 RepID=UPI0028F70572|nr:lytic polysaccharide monooxygenase [Umezawaea sp. Da 62-37]WNV84449.1 lytic polysaccharide monooxygenase [Umezawaea sp. Da 62-37]
MRTRAWWWASAVAVLYTALAVGTASAHGAVVAPVSRSAACGADGAQPPPAACKAALSASGPKASAEWDNIRVANVKGRDREVVPDGKLCSAGLREYAGLDLARADWPTSKLDSGAVKFTYRATIPHKGTFRLYLTKDGYKPENALRWADLEEQPFMTVTDPPLVKDAYSLAGTLPAGKEGRYLIYTIWQNSDTPDTYYSCSDVTLVAGASQAGAAPQPGSPQPGSTAVAAPPQVDRLASLASAKGVLIPAGIVVLGVVVVGGALFWRRRT